MMEKIGAASTYNISIHLLWQFCMCRLKGHWDVVWSGVIHSCGIVVHQSVIEAVLIPPHEDAFVYRSHSTDIRYRSTGTFGYSDSMVLSLECLYKRRSLPSVKRLESVSRSTNSRKSCRRYASSQCVYCSWEGHTNMWLKTWHHLQEAVETS